MAEKSFYESPNAVVKKNSLRMFSSHWKLTSVIAILAIFVLIYAFFSGITIKFYASFVFLFYSWTQKMWISVILLGVFQTLLLIPLRVVKLFKENNIKEFKKTIEETQIKQQQQYKFKSSFSKGNKIVLFYSLDFFVELVSYISIGKLFLIDFYTTKLNPNLLYHFVPYPEYPIKDVFFKIPYPHVIETIGLKFSWILIAWGITFIIFAVFKIMKSSFDKNKERKDQPQNKVSKLIDSTSGYFLLICFLLWLLLRHFPTQIDFRIFAGSVAIPNRTLNTITAIMTFLTLFWYGLQKNIRKAEIARNNGINEQVIEKTQKLMFKDNLIASLLVGLGAYFITNQIPSAFELSIFTLEIISLAGPVTLDKWIMKALPKKK
ncbi:hypothetical protein GYA19_04665 [Candidatus Beckwithbacteria bacterium]|nr:hypothetical protein [Candidatus Beckwithbacteria bacterium]